ILPGPPARRQDLLARLPQGPQPRAELSAMIDQAYADAWRRRLERFRPALEDPKVVRRVRQISAATLRATRYVGTPRHRLYVFGIRRRLAELTADTAVRYGLLAEMRTLGQLLEHAAFGDFVEVRVQPPEPDLQSPNRPA
ncbi:MAG: hypothetical protein M3N29_01740, partial [Chloroflexota bacterium]|nr:hypothetical protein [Chloroflexota bacterium]